MFFVFRCYLLPLGAMTLYVLNVPKRHCKNTTFPQTRKGMEDFSLFTEGVGVGVDVETHGHTTHFNPHSVHPPAILLDLGQCIPQCDGIPPRSG